MDAELVGGIGAILVGVLGLWFKDRKDKRELDAKVRAGTQIAIDARPDAALERMAKAAERADIQAARYMERLEEIQVELDTLRAKHQQCIEDMDKMMEENRSLRRELEEARIQIHKMRREANE